jgi:hypothetical protein
MSAKALHTNGVDEICKSVGAMVATPMQVKRGAARHISDRVQAHPEGALREGRA